ncbi:MULTISPECIES: LamG domain-containing protein [unclassified Actinomadura]|uniref:LamG domain-containing protein n=1 Tax=unclassified Actinomadura TaxID=2626254 RepID=UPI0011ECC122|nr:LamG domain-containing protein [Actinomadura sp. K4S16]
MRPRRTIPVLLAALAVTVPASIAGSAGTALAQASIPAPTVTSADYPDDDAWHDGVGIYGEFTIDDPSDQAARYSVSITGQPGLDLATRDGAPVTVAIAPHRSGPVYLTVQSFGPAGENSPTTDYLFLVKAGSAPKAHWKLDEPAGARQFTAEAREGDDPAVAQAAGTVSAGAEGQLGTAAHLDGGHADAAALVDTAKSFTVSAWARPATDGDSVVVAATGEEKNAFSLQSRGGHWAFVKSDADARGAAIRQAVAEQPVYPGTWAHLTGSYDATQKRLRLYVNGALASDVASGDPAWSAQGPLRLGAGVRPRAHPFLGDLDEVRVYDRIIVPAEAAALPKLPKKVHGRWKFNVDGDDDSALGNDMALRGGAAIDPNAGFYGWASPAGLRLDGTAAYAETSGPVIRTDRSFTVSTWVNTEQMPTRASTLLSLPGRNINRFALRFVPGDEPGAHTWQSAMADSDAADAKVTVATHTVSSRWWDHLAVVYDAPTRTMTLYVNGEPQENGSIKGGVGAFDAGGPLQVGRSALGDPEYWPGAVDDVWAFQGALAQQDIATLAGGAELETPDQFD